MKSKIIIGTRSSKLALWQSNHVKAELQKTSPDLKVELKEIKTKGDHITDVPLSQIGGKGLFTKEIEDALLSHEIDLAVHSLKDLPTMLPDGLEIGAVLDREKAYDVLITKNPYTLSSLRPFSRIGTSSLRRIAQLKSIRNDLEYLELRGNVDTRIKKLEDGKYDAIVIAYAGVKRLGFEEKITEHLDPKTILPAVCQGIIAIEIRKGDNEIKKILTKLSHEETYLISVSERAFLEELQGGCQVPIGAYTELNNGKITLFGLVASLDGKTVIRDSIEKKVNKDFKEKTLEEKIHCFKTLGTDLAIKLLNNGGREILDVVRRAVSK